MLLRHLISPRGGAGALLGVVFLWGSGLCVFDIKGELTPGAALVASAQGEPKDQEPEAPESYPSPTPITRKQRNDILKMNFENMKKDAGELASLAKSLQEDLEKSNENVLSLKIVEKAEKIEKLARKIKGVARGF